MNNWFIKGICVQLIRIKLFVIVQNEILVKRMQFIDQWLSIQQWKSSSTLNQLSMFNIWICIDHILNNVLHKSSRYSQIFLWNWFKKKRTSSQIFLDLWKEKEKMFYSNWTL